MTSRSRHFERFEDHTRLKHYLLSQYLKGWATILISGGARGRLLFVDAFAGEGRDAEGTPGSPVIAAEIARAVNAQHFATPLPASQGMRVVAIEADARRHAALVRHMAPHTAEPAVAYVRHGTLSQFLDGILRYADQGPAFFFLDPFGVNGLDAALLPRLFENLRAEVLVLFADEGAVRLAGKVEAGARTREELLAERRGDRAFLSEDFEAEQEEADRAAVERALAGHASNPRAREILNTAFGGNHWQAEIEREPPERRQERFVELYEAVLRSAGATHVVRFDVTTEAGRHKYTLLHASQHKRAFAAMKEAMHRARKLRAARPETTLFDAAGVEAPAEPEISSGVDVNALADAVARHFAGRTVRWTSKGKGSAGDTVQSYLRDETPVFPHEYEAVQRVFERRGLITAKKPLTYAFPADA